MIKSPLTAHSANTWVNCTGSVALSLQFPAIETGDGVSDAVLEGRAFHKVAERILKSFKTPTTDLVSKEDIVGTLSADNIVINDEIYDGALEYANDVLKVCNANGIMRDMQIEERVDLECIYPGMYGYGDCWLFDAKLNKLYIWDAKFGHKGVDAFENWQLITYAEGIMTSLGINGHTDQDLNLSLRVAQPRSFRSNGVIDVWDCKASELRGYVNTVKAAAAEAFSGDAKCKVGDQCGYCPARYACSTFQQFVYQGADYVGNVEGVSLSGHHLALELKILKKTEKALKARLSGLEAQALSEIKGGQILPGFMSLQGYGRKRWAKNTPIDEVIQMCDLLGVDARKPIDLDTPAQIIKKGIDEDVINLYSETPMTGVKLVEDSGARARNVFRPIHNSESK
tara:strand:+ start:10699 stop:11892 length:1194 start_codon:yes stop_codon:yes gene_type:complete